MTSIYEQFETDTTSETEGIVLDYGDAGWIKCARAGGANKRYQKALEKFGRRYRRQLELNILPEEVATKNLIGIYADTIILEGEVIGKDKKKVILKGNRKAVVDLFTDLPELFRDVRDQTSGAEQFKSSEREEEAKN